MKINEPCLVSINNQEYQWCRPLFVGENIVVLQLKYIPEAPYHHADVKFKPLEDENVELLYKETLEDILDGKGWDSNHLRKWCKHAVNKGWRKVGEKVSLEQYVKEDLANQMKTGSYDLLEEWFKQNFDIYRKPGK